MRTPLLYKKLSVVMVTYSPTFSPPSLMPNGKVPPVHQEVDGGKCAIDEQKARCASAVINGSDNLSRRVDAMGLGVDRAGNSNSCEATVVTYEAKFF
jgi:hypothetical protein